jgi:membrane-bound metal-dependent hydrolase YbcI (DUF457 family)
MASPIAHSFAGFWISLVLRRCAKTRSTVHWRQYLPRLGMLILLAIAPDLDMFMTPDFPGSALHRGFTHSLTVAVLISLVLSAAWRIVPGFWRSTLLYFTAYSSHILIDFFTGSSLGWTNSGYGMPLFWPWSKTFSSPLTLIFGIHHKDLTALFSLDNLLACTYELLVCTAITLVAGLLWKRRLKSQTNRPMSDPQAYLVSNLQ